MQQALIRVGEAVLCFAVFATIGALLAWRG
jgi:hypothetical protein